MFDEPEETEDDAQYALARYRAARQEGETMQVDPLYSLGLTNSLDTLTAQEDTLTGELSSGLAVTQASDDPLAASQSVELGSAISLDDAYVASASGLQSQMQVADSALGSVVSQITSAISTATSGLSGTMSSADLQTVGQQLAGIRDEVVSLANTSYAGQYLFSGTSTAQPYTNDTSTSPAVATYAGDDHQQTTVTPGGQTIVTGLAGSAIFSASGADVMASLNALVADFSSGTVSASTEADLNELQAGLTNVSSQRSILDASLNTLEQTSTYAQTNATDLQASQSTLVSADASQVATQLSTNETQQQALMDVISSMGKYNLFQFMSGS